MDILAILNNNWFVSIVSIFLGLLIVPLLNWIGALFGHFSGKYIAVTFQPEGENILIEYVRLRHTGKKAYGKIFGVCFAHLHNDKLTASKANTAVYNFDGFVDERLLILSYSTTTRSVKSSGTLTLQGNASGTIFDGVWSGFAENQVISSRCIWFQMKGTINPTKDAGKILALAYQALKEYGALPNPTDIRAVNKQVQLFGRKREISGLDDLIKSRNEPYVIFLKAGGGKTLFLNKLAEAQKAAKRKDSSVIDLYDSTQKIVKGKTKKRKR